MSVYRRAWAEFLRRFFYVHGRVYVGIKGREIDQYRSGVSNSREVQRKQLFSKLKRNADSEFGRQHGFDQIHSVEEFQRRVPITTYEYYRSFAEKVKQGDSQAMFGPGTKVLMFSMTSGTTSEPKYIPITSHFVQEYRTSWNLWGRAVFRDHKDLIAKYTLQFSSDWQQFHTEGGVPCGNISGFAVESRPLISRPIFVLPAILNKVSGAENKQYVALRLSISTPHVGMIVTANPLTLLNLARLADERRESLIRDLWDGTLSADVEIPDIVRHKLRRVFGRKDRYRARQLEKIVEDTGHLWPKDYWPGLSVLSVWTGGPVAIYLPKVREYYGESVIFRDHGLSASEGRMTTPFADETSAGLLDYATNFYEFIPEEEHDQENPTVLEAHELQEGRNYYILMTTSNGFYRYDIHDVVRCVGFEGTCPVLDFLHKGAHFSSMAGEKLSEHQVVRAVNSALDDVGLSVEHFTLAPVIGELARYALLIENQLDPDLSRRLAERVDIRLSEMNCEYEDRLTTRRLDSVLIKQVPPGTWNALRERRISRLGGSPEQFKHPFLTGKAEFIEEIMQPDNVLEEVNAK